MTDIDTIARTHAADTRSWLAEIDPPGLDVGSAVSVSATGRLEHPTGLGRRRWSPAWAFAAGFAAVLAAGVVMVALSLGGGSSDLAVGELRPVDLGMGYIWPDQPGSSSPEALGAAFAVEVLGWDQATVDSISGSDPSGPVWIRVSAPRREPIDMLTAPHQGPGRVLHQIGEPLGAYAVVPGELAGTGIGLVQHPGATNAEVTLRLIGSDAEVVLVADAGDLEMGRVETTEIPDAQQVVTVLVRYLDDNGDVITATGGDSYTGEPVDEMLDEAVTLDSLDRAATEGEGPVLVPLLIASSIDEASQEVLTRSGRTLASSRSTRDGTLRIESALYSDGKGSVELIWQDWPETMDLYAVLQDDTVVEQDGNLDLTIRQTGDDNTIEVGVFDGSVYARAYTTFTEDMTLQEVRQLALNLYAAVVESGSVLAHSDWEVLAAGRSPLIDDLGRVSLVESADSFVTLMSSLDAGQQLPVPNFEEAVVAAFTIPDGLCDEPLEVLSFEASPGGAFTPIFDSEQTRSCRSALVAITYVVSIKRSALPPGSSLRLPANTDYDYPESVVPVPTN